MGNKNPGLLRTIGSELAADAAAGVAGVAIPVPVVDVLAAGLVRDKIKRTLRNDDGPV